MRPAIEAAIDTILDVILDGNGGRDHCLLTDLESFSSSLPAHHPPVGRALTTNASPSPQSVVGGGACTQPLVILGQWPYDQRIYPRQIRSQP